MASSSGVIPDLPSDLPDHDIFWLGVGPVPIRLSLVDKQVVHLKMATKTFLLYSHFHSESLLACTSCSEATWSRLNSGPVDYA